MNWHYSNNGQRNGPVDQTEFERLVATNVITAQTLVWREGMADWVAYDKLQSVQAAPTGGATGDTEVCAVSGKRFPRREMMQYEGKWISAQHRDEYFQRLREGLGDATAGAVPGPFGYGGFWRRFCARFIDGLLLWVVNMIIMIPLMALMVGGGPSSGVMIGVQLLLNLFSIAVGMTYEVVMLRSYGATLGKKAMGLKVVRTDGAVLSVGRCFGRYFSQWISAIILAIGYIMAAFDPEKRALHDRICDTRVIRTR